MIAARTRTPCSSTGARSESAQPRLCRVAKPCSRAYCAVREIVTTRRRESQSSATIESTNGVAER